MTYSTIRDFVQNRASATGSLRSSNLHTVSLRLEQYRVRELDLLSLYLGYASRQQATAALLGTAIDDALQELSEALSDDSVLHARFTQDRLHALGDMD